ncbi:VOC family protein [Mesobacillus boroniphilus]|uniref:VOC family protein n=1 Tax=Mesobacillus boroniphilus TaxID=308892 RepID=A0A944GW37_9BACI|nr:VOC family protein [Mesobacillus boroniphilus]MBS8264234.1 VOC family protein [Mesobacillus boroniphilus]
MRFHHFALEVNDMKRSQTFYETFLGFNESERIYFNKEEIIFLKQDGFRLELYQKKADGGIGERFHFCFEVDNLDEKMKEMSEREYDPFEGPYTLVNGWKTIFYLGPDNEVIEFLEVT